MQVSGSYPRQNGFAVALRERAGSSARCSSPDWLQSVELSRRVHAGLDQGEARNFCWASRGVLQPPWGNQGSEGVAALGRRASGLNRDGGYRAVEHGVPKRHLWVGRGRQAGGRRAAVLPAAAGL